MLLNLGNDLVQSIVFEFCTAKEVRALALLSKAFHNKFPREWTVDQIHVMDNPLPPTRRYVLPRTLHYSSEMFEKEQQHLVFLKRLAFHHAHYSGALTLPPSKHLQEFSLTSVWHVKEIEVSRVSRYLQEIMINCSWNVTALRIPPTCVHLRELWIHGCNLSEFHLRPEWNRMRTLVLFRAGHFTDLTIPATYVSLEVLHVIHCGVERVRILPKKFTSSLVQVRIREFNPVSVHHFTALSIDISNDAPMHA